MFLLETYINLQETQLVFGKLLKLEIFCLRSSTGRLYEKVNCRFLQHKLHFLLFVVTIISLKGNICFTNLRLHIRPENKLRLFLTDISYV